MEVSLEVLGPTARALRVTVPQQRFAEQVENRLRQLSRTLRIKGFRPGKIPVQVVRQYHLPQVYGEVMEKLANDSLREALATEQVQPVVDPKVTVEEYGEDRPMKYQARFDVYPELAESKVTEVEVTDPEVAVEDAEVEEGMERLRRQHVDWKAVERPAASGDQVGFIYTTCGMDETLAEIAEDSPDLALVLEPGAMLEELHEHLQGMNAGDEKQVQVSFAEKADGHPLSGQTRQFRLRMREVREAVLPDWEDAAWLEQCGGAGATREDIRNSVHAHLDYRRTEMRREYLAVQITQGLVAAGGPALPVPESLREWCLSARLKEMGVPPEQELGEDHPARQVALMDAQRITVFQALRALSGAEPSEQDLQQVEKAYAGQFKDPAAARRNARRNPDVSGHLQREATWDALIRWTLDRARVNKARMTLEQLGARTGR